MKAAKAVGIQYAALPYRVRNRKLEVMLITSRETRRWVIPKGWPITGLSPPEAAAMEAAEEAGVIGDIESQPLGSYQYLKRAKGGERITVQVIAFPFRVEAHAATYKEAGQRDVRWLSYQHAAGMVAEPSLRRLIREFGRARTPRFMALVRGSLRCRLFRHFRDKAKDLAKD